MVDEISNPALDRIVTRILATAQLLISLACLAIVPFAFMYGGAAVWPSLFQSLLLYCFYGAGSAIFLYSRLLAARILALTWHVIFVAYFIVRLFAARPGASIGPFWLCWFLLSALSILYLAKTSLPTIHAAAKNNPKATMWVILGAFATFLAMAGLYYFTDVSVTGLEAQLHSRESDVRCVAARRLGSKGPAARSALPALESMLNDTSCVDSGEYADDTPADIEKIGGIDPLIDAMKKGNSVGRSSAAWHLKGSVARYPDRALDLEQVFATGLKDSNGLVRHASVAGLGELGPKAADLVPEVQKLINDPDFQVRSEVVTTIARMNSLDSLRELMSSPDEQIRSEVVQVLSERFGAASVPALVSALGDRSPSIATQAARALGSLGMQALPALSALEDAALRSANYETRLTALEALKQLGREGLPAIAKASADSDERVRDYALALLGSYGQAGVPALTSFLDHPCNPGTTKAVDVLEPSGGKRCPL